MTSLAKRNILGVSVTDARREDVLQYITTSLDSKNLPYYIVTPNPEMIVLAQQNADFKIILNQARIALADGVGLKYAAVLLGLPLKERITGTDFVEDLCAAVARHNAINEKKPITVGFLGGRDRIAEKTAECLLGRYPKLRVAFVAQEWGEEGFEQARKFQTANSKHPEENKRILSTVYKSDATNIDILFIALGFPKQELWMAEHIGKTPIGIMMGVGGAFDYISGTVSRAPRILRTLGLEWLYRLIRQPWRFRRQFALVYFVFIVLSASLKRSREV